VAVGQVVSRYAVCEPTSFIAGNEHIASQVIFEDVRADRLMIVLSAVQLNIVIFHPTSIPSNITGFP
jgi:hypothetical protein